MDDVTRQSELRATEKVAELETQMASMRQRSQKILEDKDNELELLRKTQQEQTPQETDSIAQLMQNGDNNLDTALILYAEQVTLLFWKVQWVTIRP